MFGAGRMESWENGQNTEFCMPEGDKDYFRAENEKKNTSKFMK